MPNGGFDGSIEDWQKMEAPLLEIDGLLAQFAGERNMQVIKNYHNWPQRYLNWVRDGIYRSMQLLAVDADNLTFHFSIVAWEDKNDRRYLADELIRRAVPWTEMRNELPSLLERGTKTLETWSEKDLKPAQSG